MAVEWTAERVRELLRLDFVIYWTAGMTSVGRDGRYWPIPRAIFEELLQAGELNAVPLNDLGSATYRLARKRSTP